MSEGCRERGIILGGEEESEGSGGMEGKRERGRLRQPSWKQVKLEIKE